jgi:hypothetical protein
MSINKSYITSDSLELMNETLGISLCQKKFNYSKDFIAKFPILWKSNVTISPNIEWIDMKNSHGWGFIEGSQLHPIIDWIYIRPDVFKELKSETVGSLTGIFQKGILNTHYFFVKTKAIEFFKSRSTVLKSAPKRNIEVSTNEVQYFYDENEESEDSGECSNSGTESKKKAKKLRLVDDEAVEK